MFAKSLKYELRASARVLVPIFICLLVVSILVSLGFAWIGGTIRNFGGYDEGGNIELNEETLKLVRYISVALVVLMLVFVVLMMASALAVFILMVRRFYKSFFTDEGYLTFTLPVSIDCHLATKTVSMIIWNAANNLVIFLSIGLFALGMYTFIPEDFHIDQAIINEIADIIGDNFSTTIIFGTLNSLISNISSYFLLFFGISFGCMITKKHRVISSIISVIVISGVFSQIIQAITNFVIRPFAEMDYSLENMDFMLATTLIISTILYSIQGAACYFGARWILKNKVNLD